MVSIQMAKKTCLLPVAAGSASQKATEDFFPHHSSGPDPNLWKNLIDVPQLFIVPFSLIDACIRGF
jgi:hypothetical protein